MRYTLFTVLFAGCLKLPDDINNLEIDRVLSAADGKSENLIYDKSVQQIIKGGNSNLQPLIEKFPDTTRSNVYSNCCNRYLSKGELALIMADHIDKMPYFLLTGIQNCTQTFCADNPNNIEYYLNIIKEQKEINTVSEKYRKWLNDRE